MKCLGIKPTQINVYSDDGLLAQGFATGLVHKQDRMGLGLGWLEQAVDAATGSWRQLGAGPQQHHREHHPAGALRPAVAGPLAAAGFAHSTAAGPPCVLPLPLVFGNSSI